MRIEVLTVFPDFVAQVAEWGVVGRAVEAGRVAVHARDLRAHADNRWGRVDERPFGGGPGMVLNAEPVARALDAALEPAPGAKVIGLSPQGEPLTQHWVRRLASEDALVLLCGRYEGWDERLAPRLDVELSLGDFVLSGGELAAMALIDAVARLLPGVLGDERSAGDDSFSDGRLDHPHWTRPEDWRGEAVPEVLLSGDHAAIRRWRLKRALGMTWLKRPDLLEGLALDEEHEGLLREFIAERQAVKRSGT